MVWFSVFLLGLGSIIYGFIRAIRTQKPDLYMLNGGFVAAIGFMGYSRWPALPLIHDLPQKQAAFLLLGAGGWLAALWTIYQLIWSLRALAWPSVQGTITHSEAVFLGHNNNTATSGIRTTRHTWRVTYSYAVGHSTYTSTTRALDTDDEDTDFSNASRLAQRYPVGCTVAVYHHPRDPQFACLDRSWFNARWYVPAGLAAMMLWLGNL